MSDGPLLPTFMTLNASGTPYSVSPGATESHAAMTVEEIEALDEALIVNGRWVCSECGGAGGPCSECGRLT